MVYTVSDLHGDLIMYNHIVNQLKEDDTLYIVGDIIDRGNSGIAILQDVMKRPNVELLLGNHEWFLIMMSIQWMYGGIITAKDDYDELLDYLLTRKVSSR